MEDAVLLAQARWKSLGFGDVPGSTIVPEVQFTEFWWHSHRKIVEQSLALQVSMCCTSDKMQTPSSFSSPQMVMGGQWGGSFQGKRSLAQFDWDFTAHYLASLQCLSKQGSVYNTWRTLIAFGLCNKVFGTVNASLNTIKNGRVPIAVFVLPTSECSVWFDVSGLLLADLPKKSN